MTRNMRNEVTSHVSQLALDASSGKQFIRCTDAGVAEISSATRRARRALRCVTAMDVCRRMREKYEFSAAKPHKLRFTFFDAALQACSQEESFSKTL